MYGVKQRWLRHQSDAELVHLGPRGFAPRGGCGGATGAAPHLAKPPRSETPTSPPCATTAAR